jgi:uncharacterized protein YraI
MHLGVRTLALLGAMVLAVTCARAADTFRVVNVPPGDVLNIRAGPDVSFPVLGTLPRNARGVPALGECVEGWCPLRRGVVLGWSSGRYLRREGSAPDQQASGGQPAPAAAGAGTVLPDGTLERLYPDGRRVRRLPSGRLQTIWPDGSVSQATFVQVPIATLPALPAELSTWGSNVEDELLTILDNILTDPEMEAYRTTEEGKGFYQLLDWRLRSIHFLTTPAS